MKTKLLFAALAAFSAAGAAENPLWSKLPKLAY